MIYGQIPLGSMPINLVMLPATQEVVFTVIQPFTTVFDQSTDTEDAYFDMTGFVISGNAYDYNTAYKYKELPDMLSWLQKQQLMLEELIVTKSI